MGITRKFALLAFAVLYIVGCYGLIQFGKSANWPDWALTIIYVAIVFSFAMIISRRSTKPTDRE